MRIRNVRCLVVAALLLTGCKKFSKADPKPESSVHAEATASAATKAPPVASVTSAPAPPPVATAPVFDEGKLELHHVYEDQTAFSQSNDIASTITMSVLHGATLFGLGDSLFRAEGDKLQLVTGWGGGGVHTGGFSVLELSINLGGRFPDALWGHASATVFDGARTTSHFDRVTHRRGTHWVVVSGGPRIGRVVAWSHGRTLASTEAGFEILDGPRDGKPPAPTKGKGDCATRVARAAFDALPSGEVFVFGHECGTEHLAVERFAPDAKKGVVDRLPPPVGFVHKELGSLALRAASPTSVWATAFAGKPSYLAHFDGKVWTYVQPPPDFEIHDLSAAEDGSAFVLGRGKTLGFRISREGHWTPLAFAKDAAKEAKDFTPVGLYAAGSDDAWVAGYQAVARNLEAGEPGGYRSFVLRTRTGTRTTIPVLERDYSFVPRIVYEERSPVPIHDACKTPFVQLYGAKVNLVGSDYAFPSTGKALEGEKRFANVEFLTYGLNEEPGLEFLGGIVANQEEGEELVVFLKKKVKGSNPRLVCFLPKTPMRQIRFDTR